MRILIFISLIIPFSAIGQYSNSWINYSQTYFKIKVDSNAIYKLTYEQLQLAGMDVSAVDPRRFQLFHHGKEQSIDVKGQNNGQFESGEYIEFYGKKNDGALDVNIYNTDENGESNRPHAYAGIYTNESYYYLTYPLTPVNGKRVISTVWNDPQPVENYHIKENLELFYANYSKGQTERDYNALTIFDKGEGFTDSRIVENTANDHRDYILKPLTNSYTSGTSPSLEVVLVGRNKVIHNLEIWVGPDASNLRMINTYGFQYFNKLVIQEPLLWSDIGSQGEIMLRVASVNDGDLQSNISVSAIKLEYPQTFDMSLTLSKQFNIQAKSSGASMISINNTPINARVFDVSNEDNVSIVINTSIIPNTVNCGFQDGSIAKELFVTDQSALVPPIEKITFDQIIANDYDYIIISNKVLMQPVTQTPDAVAAYADYRKSIAGGSFRPLVIEVSQVFDQFGFGEPSPYGIREFMRFMIEEGNPKYLFIIGKALEASNNYYRRDKSEFTYHDLVPTAGVPGSDMAFTAGLNGTTYEPAVPTGRITASTPDQVLAYLNKIKEMESLPFDALWRKNILHLSGGRTETELFKFKAYVDGFKNISEQPFMGASVTSKSKEEPSAVQFINAADEINNGVNIITFFGHSAPGVTDIDIGYVSDEVHGYDNKSKYPVLLMNGCSAGNMYLHNYVFSEDWVLTGDKGATAVIAHSSFGNESTLKLWSNTFYSLAYSDSTFINNGIGDVQKEVGRLIIEGLEGIPPNYLHISQIQQMVLHGDPAVSLFGTNISDVEINENSVVTKSWDGELIVAESDSFALNLIVRNFGAYVHDSLEVVVKRTLQTGEVIVYDTVSFPSVAYTDTLTFNIPNQLENNFGNNIFDIFLDPADKIKELNEMNNTATVRIFVPLSGTINLSPIDYSIQGMQLVDLLAQSGSLLEDKRGFQFQIDTTKLFTSPVLKSYNIDAKVLARWPDIDLEIIGAPDTLAYYWRTKYTVLKPNELDEWNTGSFTYINGGVEGWTQGQYYQFDDNSLHGLVRNQGNRSIDFKGTSLSLNVKTFGAQNPDFGYGDVELLIGDVAYLYGTGNRACWDNTINMVVFNRQTASPYAAYSGYDWQAWTCGREPQVINSFPKGVDFELMLDAVPEGEYVLLFTIGQFDFNSLSASTLQKLGQMGANINTLTTKTIDEPYILFGWNGVGQNNAIAEIIEDPLAIDPKANHAVTFSTDIVGVYSSGSMVSSLIGPSNQWQEVSINVDKKSTNAFFDYDVLGYGHDGQETILKTGVSATSLDVSDINSANHPFIKLRLNVSDTSNLQSPQLNRWIVSYEPVAEGLLAYLGNNQNNGKTVEVLEGENSFAEFGFINVSDKLFSDSLSVLYSLFNKETRKSLSYERKIKSPAPNDTSKFTLELESIGLVGTNDFKVFVNPQFEPERIYLNNNISLPNFLVVNREETNPILDVAFDGRYIFDGEIVTPSPLISIKMKDEGAILLKQDTVGIEVFLKKPCEGCDFNRVALSGNEVEWFAATDKEDFKIIYKPQQLKNGMHTLRVQVEDASGNLSGKDPYMINFEVINESTITNFYPYPNPFSSSVRFIFTLTGQEIPSEILIRIMTLSGRVVREITQAELGPIRIGNNSSDYSWDGRDEFGDQLSNGVYLYQVKVKINNEQVDHRTVNNDRGFEKGYGKLYLLR